MVAVLVQFASTRAGHRVRHAGQTVDVIAVEPAALHPDHVLRRAVQVKSDFIGAIVKTVLYHKSCIRSQSFCIYLALQHAVHFETNNHFGRVAAAARLSKLTSRLYLKHPSKILIWWLAAYQVRFRMPWSSCTTNATHTHTIINIINCILHRIGISVLLQPSEF